MRLDQRTRYLVVVHAIWDGKCALFDTETNDLLPFGEGRSAVDQEQVAGLPER